jgi:hypothetical protein
MKKNILVIDDERRFPKMEESDHVTYVRSAEEAIIVLYTHRRWNEIWFDHDLGYGPTAMKVVNWMKEQDQNHNFRWYRFVDRAYIHSMNPAGATQIRFAIEDLGIPVTKALLPVDTVAI